MHMLAVKEIWLSQRAVSVKLEEVWGGYQETFPDRKVCKASGGLPRVVVVGSPCPRGFQKCVGVALEGTGQW